MGRKTRSQKIIAELRRKIRASQISSSLEQEKKVDKTLIEIRENFQPVIKERESAIPSYNLNFIRRDLLKTFFLTATIISLELMLYWSLEHNGLKILQNLLSKKF